MEGDHARRSEWATFCAATGDSAVINHLILWFENNPKGQPGTHQAKHGPIRPNWDSGCNGEAR